MSFLPNLFSPSPKKVSIHHFNKGRDFYLHQQWSDALPHSNIALEHNLEEFHPSLIADPYEMRGVCLGAKRVHPDAIKDFNKSISLVNNNCNVFFQKVTCKGSNKDYKDMISDLEVAIELSEIDNALNRQYHPHAREMGYKSATALYRKQLSTAKLQLSPQTSRNNINI